MKARLWPAREDGRNTSVTEDVKAVATSDFLWLGRGPSIPLAWVEEITAVGPGIKVLWHNPLTGADEASFFCIRTMFGYNKKKSAAFIANLRSLVKDARSTGAAHAAAMASEDPRCQVCGEPADVQLDFTWIMSFLLYFSSRADRRLLCAVHARRRFIRGMVSNTLLAPLGIPGIMLGPYFSYRQGKIGRSLGLLSGSGHALFVIASIVTGLLLVLIVITAIAGIG